MDETTKVVQEYYNNAVQDEWERVAGRPEFLLTCRMLNRYIKLGQKVLDIGGGPGRYSLYLAGKGCDVTLFDLSTENVAFAAERAKEQGLCIQAIAGDAREVDKLVSDMYDHILLMGPMYHLLEEDERIKAVEAALKLLKPGGIIYVSFISMMGGIIHYMKYAPDFSADPCGYEYLENFAARKSHSGDAFTKAAFTDQSEVLPFMSQFPLDKLHLFAQEGLMTPCESNIMSQSKEVVDAWLDLCEKIWDREEFLSWGEHLMYVGRKK